jgi:acetylornithine deacetylase
MAFSYKALYNALGELVAIPSISSVDPRIDTGNRPVVDTLATWFDDLGFSIEIMELPGRPGKANLIARSAPGDDGLILSGHTDTVPYDEHGWDSDPFTISERGGRLYGLGVTDMKCFFPVVIAALREIDLKQLKRPVIVLATADEECTMAGARALVDAGRCLGKFAVIGEPTGLTPIAMHKGVMTERIVLHGHSGHSSDPSLGRNALEGMQKVMTALLAWREQLQQRYRNEAFKVPVPTMNLGHIHGGDAPNRICADCELQIDLRPLPGMDLDGLRAEIAERVHAAVAGLDLRAEVQPLSPDMPGVPPMITAADSPIVKLTEELTGRGVATVAFGTEGPYLNALGSQTVILGPGDIDQAHQPNEYVAIDRLESATEIFKNLILRCCA